MLTSVYTMSFYGVWEIIWHPVKSTEIKHQNENVLNNHNNTTPWWCFEGPEVAEWQSRHSYTERGTDEIKNVDEYLMELLWT